LGTLGYVRSALELNDQLPPERDRDLQVILASSSGGTLAGLVAGFALLQRSDVDLLAVSSDTPAETLRETAMSLAARALELLEVDPVRLESMESRLDVTDAEVGLGYGIPTEGSREATTLLARSEGLLVDPVYTSKALAGLVRAVRAGRFPAGDRIVFVHTGGHPGLFA
jgi:L-cysteate sulfo-lyase